MKHEEISEGIYYSKNPSIVKRILADPYHRIAKMNKWSLSVSKGNDYQFVFAVCKPGQTEIFWTKFDISDSSKTEEIADMICAYLDIEEKKVMMKFAFLWGERFKNYNGNTYGLDFDEMIKGCHKFLDLQLTAKT